MAELRISELSGQPAGQRRVRVLWQEERSLPREGEAVFADPSDEGDGERVRWYLEDYAEFPADPAPTLAREAEARLREIGTSLFRLVFEANPDTMLVWASAVESLSQARVEVGADPGSGSGLPWELLRDPRRDAAVALGAEAFVRTHYQAAGKARRPEPSGDRLRVLLVVARPGGRADVPFRSVASRLVRGGAEQMPGLDLDVLRPATFARLSEVLRAAHDAGRPYHVVHFDGHGTYVDLEDLGFISGRTGGGGLTGARVALSRDKYVLSVAGPVRGGQHGYLLFEDPQGTADRQGTENQQLVDGPTLGRLLADTGVPVLVLNACRSAYAEARSQPADAAGEAAGHGVAEGDPGFSPAGAQTSPANVGSTLTGDVHARIRAYGSLAAEVSDAGVPGVVAMRYNVYVVTAAQFVADLYAHLLAGESLGEAAAAARRALAADPVRQIGAVGVSLQDWTVPVVYESAPLVLLRPEQRDAPLVKLNPGQTRTGQGAGGVPRPPDAGFFGRDETLLALDRAFDTQPIVLLHAYAGAGKSSTAAEFARWYAVTGGLDWPGHPEWPGAVLWSSFEHHLTADRVVGAAGDFFAPVLEGSGIAWAAVTDPAERRDIALQVLAQIPVLWVWDNIEPVTGFPAGSPSDWSAAEQDNLADLLRELAQRTQCKVLLTSRRDERHWLGDLPARVRLPPMPMRESLQLAAALADRQSGSVVGTDWRPLLRYAGGNPLTVTVVVGQALREDLITAEQIEGFVTRLRAGEADVEAAQDVELGRSRSLAASLGYGFAQAFTEAERAQLAVLHLFRDTADVDALRFMGDSDAVGQDSIPALASLDRGAGLALLDRAAGIGLLEPLGGGYYKIHPALPWYFTTLFATTYGEGGIEAAEHIARAYAQAIGGLGDYYLDQVEKGRAAHVFSALRAEEANLRHALDLARAFGLWRAAMGCLQGLNVLYARTGRESEWSRLVVDSTPDFTDPLTGGPLPGREGQWGLLTTYRARLAQGARDWASATTLLNALIAWDRDRASVALTTPTSGLTDQQRNLLRALGVALTDLGNVLLFQGDPGCLPYFQEALALDQRIGDRAAEAQDAGTLGAAYLHVPGLRDLDQAAHWFQHSLSLREDTDQLGRARNHNSLGEVALARFDDALAAKGADAVLLKHINAALRSYEQALDLTPADDHYQRGLTENQLGLIYGQAGVTREALRHMQQSIQHREASGDIFSAGETRQNIAVLLAEDDRFSEALHYARAALHNFQDIGPPAAVKADEARQFIAVLERRAR